VTGPTFNDHFSHDAPAYAAYRPRYPAELFDWLAEQSTERTEAWDAGTGNGQAAVDLAERFAHVTATDPSAEQIEHAIPHPRVTYKRGTAEESGLDAASFALVTVAQALHWFNIPAFFAEARRVLKPGGVLAAWTYREPELDDDLADKELQQFSMLVHPYWPAERAIVESGYRTVAFPFEPVKAPRFDMEHSATLEMLTGYLRTWSATTLYMKETGLDPVRELEDRLARLWADGERRQLTWELHVRAGRKKGDSVIG
jgi:SAM-dependent methyltransferase